MLLPKEGHEEVADAAAQLGKYCIDEPVKSPLIFGGEFLPTSLANQTILPSYLVDMVLWLRHSLTECKKWQTLQPSNM